VRAPPSFTWHFDLLIALTEGDLLVFHLPAIRNLI